MLTYTTTTKHQKINQVTELTPEETENPLGGYGRTVAHVVIGLKTTKGSKQLRLDPSIYESLQVCFFVFIFIVCVRTYRADDERSIHKYID